MKNPTQFQFVSPFQGVSLEDWSHWPWQMKHALRSARDFSQYFDLTQEQLKIFENPAFKIQVTPYYAQLILKYAPKTNLHQILLPDQRELSSTGQQMLDPLGEKIHSPVPRIIHRYTDRLLLLLTDTCSVYCRYCTRKHFTGKDSAFLKKSEYERALDYIQTKKSVREVILSGGDPLTLSDEKLEKVFQDLYKIEHINIVRVATRMPVVSPMRMTPNLAKIFRSYGPVFLMTHFNHPLEISLQSAEAIENLVDAGVPVFNQLVLLNGINNHPNVIKELSYRLLALRAKPYYMFQCDPSEGTDHFRTSIEDSLAIQKELWGATSGLALPNLSLDIPGGGGKIGLVPNYEIQKNDSGRVFKGWDGREGEYKNPLENTIQAPPDAADY